VSPALSAAGPERAGVIAPSTGPAAGSSPVPADDSPYWTFYDEVASAQLAAWMPGQPHRVLDLSGDRSRFARQLVDAGHEVVHVRPPWTACPPAALAAAAGTGVAAGRLLPVVADGRSLGWLQDASVDAVLAESQALSLCLATETTAAELLRVLRPGGRLLLVVESLVLGLARLADQGRWAELADVPSADVVLVPATGGEILRCFWPEELEGLLSDVGFDVDWVRPRSVLSPNAVVRALTEGGTGALRALVKTEVALSAERQGESTGIHLVASARRPRRPG
jgi:SAM-dependent methyltransferase